MRRLASVNGVSTVVIVASLAALAFTPMRQMVPWALGMTRSDKVVTTGLPLSALKREVARRPRDANAWLALAVAPAKPGTPGPINTAAFEHVFTLRPSWAAPHLILGRRLANETPRVWRPEIRAINPRFGDDATYRKTPLTSAQRETLRRARAALLKASALDPGNAAPEYLLAYLDLTEHRDGEALARLRSATAKRRWESGQREAGAAYYEMALRRMPAAFAAMVVVGATSPDTFDDGATLRHLGRIVGAMAIQAEQRGDVARAVFLRRSMMHLSRVMLDRPYTTTEAIGVQGVWTFATTEPLTPAEIPAALKGLPKGDMEAVTRAKARVREAKVAAWLTSHGQADLGRYVVIFGDRLRAWFDYEQRALPDRMWDGLGDTIWAMMLGVTAAIPLLGGALLWLLHWVARLTLSMLRRRPAPISWSPWKWVALIAAGWAVAAGVVYVVAEFDAFPEAPAAMTVRALPLAARAAAWFTVSGLLALPFIIIAIGVVTVLVSRKTPRAERRGWWDYFIGTLPTVLLPVTALLIASTVPLTWQAQRLGRRGAAHFDAMIYKGELESFGIRPPRLPDLPIAAETRLGDPALR